MAKDVKQSPAAPQAAKTKPAPKRRRKPRMLPPYNVVLLNDDDHTYEYVIEMLGVLFGYGIEKAFAMAEEVDANERVIVYTSHKELAELKRDQIHAYGMDPRIAHFAGGMSAIIEPAPT